MQPPCLRQLARMLRQQQAPCHSSAAIALLQELAKHGHEVVHAAAAACLLGRHLLCCQRHGPTQLPSSAAGSVPKHVSMQVLCKAVPHALPNTANPPLLCRNVAKHGRELARMQHPRHRELVCVVEAALAVMRLSCERYFVLLSVLATYLLFRDRVPRPARQLIRLNHQLCRLFQRVSHCLSCCRAYYSQLQPLLLRPGSSQARLTMVPALLQVILLSFPAVCWIYGAGFIFSAFVSVIFWGHHAQVLACSA